MATVRDGRLVFACPECDNVIRARPETVGLSGRCVKCGHTFTIPDQSDPVEAPAPVVEGKTAESALYPARTKGPPRHPASSPPVADTYGNFGHVFLAVGILATVASAVALASNATIGTAGVVIGVTLMITSMPMFAVATLIRDTRTTADCMRHLIDRVDDWKREGRD